MLNLQERMFHKYRPVGELRQLDLEVAVLTAAKTVFKAEKINPPQTPTTVPSQNQ